MDAVTLPLFVVLNLAPEAVGCRAGKVKVGVERKEDGFALIAVFLVQSGVANRQFEGDLDAEGDGVAVRLAGQSFVGVSGGVAEIENAAQVTFEGIAVDDVGFQADGSVDQAVEVRRGSTGKVSLRETAPETGVVDAEDLEGFDQAVAHLRFGESGQEVVVADNDAGGAEHADDILDSEKIDGRLAADGRIHLADQGRGHGGIRNSAHIERGRETGQVGDDTAADGEEQRAAVSVEPMQPGQDPMQRSFGFSGLGTPKQKPLSGLGHGGSERALVEAIDPIIANDEDGSRLVASSKKACQFG